MFWSNSDYARWIERRSQRGMDDSRSGSRDWDDMRRERDRAREEAARLRRDGR